MSPALSASESPSPDRSSPCTKPSPLVHLLPSFIRKSYSSSAKSALRPGEEYTYGHLDAEELEDTALFTRKLFALFAEDVRVLQ